MRTEKRYYKTTQTIPLLVCKIKRVVAIKFSSCLLRGRRLINEAFRFEDSLGVKRNEGKCCDIKIYVKTHAPMTSNYFMTVGRANTELMNLQFRFWGSDNVHHGIHSEIRPETREESFTVELNYRYVNLSLHKAHSCRRAYASQIIAPAQRTITKQPSGIGKHSSCKRQKIMTASVAG